MSAMRCAGPGEPLYNVTFPLAPTGTTTRFGTVWPGVKFRFEANGNAVPEAKAVMKPAVVDRVVVTFMTTADTPVEGTPPWPATWTSTAPRLGTAAAAA